MIRLTKSCPKCGESVPDEAKFCLNCGYAFEGSKSNVLSSFNMGRLFLILIVAVIVIGAAYILTYNGGGNGQQPADDANHVVLTITDVGGWDSDSSSKKSYTLYTSALFTNVPKNIKGYLVKTIYYDKDNKQIGQVTESLDYVYYETDYDLSFGYYTTYAKPNPDHVGVQIIKDGKIIDNYTDSIDTSTIDFLN